MFKGMRDKLGKMETQITEIRENMGDVRKQILGMDGDLIGVDERLLDIKDVQANKFRLQEKTNDFLLEELKFLKTQLHIYSSLVESIATDSFSVNKSVANRLGQVEIDLYKQNKGTYERYLDALKLKGQIERERIISKIDLKRFYSRPVPPELADKTAEELYDLREKLRKDMVVYERGKNETELRRAKALFKYLEDV